MKHLIFIFSLLATNCIAQIDDTAIDPTTDIYVLLENGTIEAVMYYRLNYVERSNGQVVNQRTQPLILEEFLPFAYREKARWEESVAQMEADIARLEAIKAFYDQIVFDLSEMINGMK